MQYLGYYGYPYYWGGAGLWGGGVYPGAMLTGVGYGKSGAEDLVARADRTRAESDHGQDVDTHLCSCRELLRYHIEATDGGMGDVKSLLVDEDTWAIRYLIVETSEWWFGKQVLISPQWSQEMSWPDATIAVNLTRQAVKGAPPYDATMPMNRDQDMQLHQLHGRGGYWADEVNLENPQYRLIGPASSKSSPEPGVSAHPRT